MAEHPQRAVPARFAVSGASDDATAPRQPAEPSEDGFHDEPTVVGDHEPEEDAPPPRARRASIFAMDAAARPSPPERRPSFYERIRRRPPVSGTVVDDGSRSAADATARAARTTGVATAPLPSAPTALQDRCALPRVPSGTIATMLEVRARSRAARASTQLARAQVGRTEPEGSSGSMA